MTSLSHVFIAALLPFQDFFNKQLDFSRKPLARRGCCRDPYCSHCSWRAAAGWQPWAALAQAPIPHAAAAAETCGRPQLRQAARWSMAYSDSGAFIPQLCHTGPFTLKWWSALTPESFPRDEREMTVPLGLPLGTEHGAGCSGQCPQSCSGWSPR